jgi:kynurenine formamidase
MKLIDLSHTLNADTPIYPGDFQIALEPYKRFKVDRYNAYLLKSGLHVGTHIDTPMHLLPDERMVASFPLERFIGRGVLLDVRGEGSIRMKEKYEKIIAPGDIVLLFTGFDSHFNNEKIYFHAYPCVEQGLVDFFISRRISILGMDMFGPDYPPFPTHQALLSQDIFLLENLTNLQSLVGVQNFEVIAFPLKIGAEASFVRAAARVL